MKITKVHIKNYKLFKDREFNLKNTTIIVGNNGVGKSTIVEAINLALTGYYHGKSILRELNQDMFNKECVEEYLASLKTPNKLLPPSIEISLYFDAVEDWRGNDTPDGSSADGFTFVVQFDDEHHKKDYESLIEEDKLASIPIEYYQVFWRTFAREHNYSTTFNKFKGLIIDSDNFANNNVYTSRIIKEFFDDDAAIKMSQSQRVAFSALFENETVSAINGKISENAELREKDVSIGVQNVSRTSWETLLSTNVKGIPFDNVGKGEQCMIKTYLSFVAPKTKNKGIIMIEEPESHLSYSNLNKILSYIKDKLSEFQIIITTHSSFVLNKLGLDNLLLVSKENEISFDDLCDDNVKFFEKRSGYDTLRFLLCEKSILVEGDSDELIVQRAYLDKYGKLPIENGIDIITVSLSFLRFLEIAKKLQLTTSIITDNDSNLTAIKDKYKNYEGIENISINYDKKVFNHDDTEISKEKVPNLNTLEPALLRANSLVVLNKVLGTDYENSEDLLHFMIKNKTDVAWKIFKSKDCINYPGYIMDAIS